MATAKHPAAAPEAGADPRVVRTRRMFADALAKLLTRKSFEEISIQEIADEATLNRATFYLHYGDKTALLEELTASRFRDLVSQRGLTFSGCDGGIRAIALGVCDYLLEEGGCPGQIDKLPFENSIIRAIEAIFREGAPSYPLPQGVDSEVLGTAAAWAIFGTARRWFQEPKRSPAEEMASRIEDAVKPIFSVAELGKPKQAARRRRPSS